jgi:signal transduction histidine kinase
MMGMDWWLLFSAGTAACVALVYVISAARGRGPRPVGWGAALVPVTALWLWALGATAPLYTFPPRQHWQITVLADGLFGIPSQMARFWLGLTIVAVTAGYAVLAPRRAGYLAAVALLAFPLYETFVGLAVMPRAYEPGWFDWFFIGLTRLVGWPVVLATAIAGVSLTRRTIVADVRAGRATLTAQVEHLAETRTVAVDTAAAELRRLERDLHDGAQARLVALGINLRAAERLIRTSPDDAAALVAECRETSAQALSELRNLVRGIYPPVLADRGLGDAVRALTLDCPVPVVTEVSLPGRPPAPVESAMYFAVAEVLNNVAKHADASSALVRVHYADGMLRAEITDDGNGGADAGNGTGLAGIERRLSAFDGILSVNSPFGGPTIIVIEVPCALSSPKISTS